MIINKTLFLFFLVFFAQKNISIAQVQRKQKHITSTKECFMLKFGYNLLFVETDSNYFLKNDTIEILQICAVNPQAVFGRSYKFFDNKVNTYTIKSIPAREPQYDKKNDSLIAWWSDTLHIFRVTLFFQNNLNKPVSKNSLSYN
ncbi:MAG: hypothetical protein KA319_07805, partial [Ferruginibacter sp.]|nr:hypothetical protein [Ferruginibacter sp.]